MERVKLRKSLLWLFFFAFALGAACSAAVAQDAQAKIEQYMVTDDDGYLFVANERGGTITVVNLKQARASGFKSSGIVGNIPAGEAPIAVTLSPDDKRLYSTSERASEHLAAGGARCDTEAPGEIEVIDVARAEKDPAHSVLSLVPGGCEPVRLVLSDDGAIAYVTARGEGKVLAFDTGRLRAIPRVPCWGRYRPVPRRWAWQSAWDVLSWRVRTALEHRVRHST